MVFMGRLADRQLTSLIEKATGDLNILQVVSANMQRNSM